LADEHVSAAAKTYLSAIGATAIYISVEQGKAINVGVARDLDAALRHLRKIVSPAASLGWIAWGMNYERLAEIAQMPHLFHDLPPDAIDEMAVRVEMMAAAHGVVLTPHARALERAEVYAGYLDKALEGMQRNGTFAAFNQAYKDHRQALARRNESAQPYWAVMQDLRAVIIRALVADPKNRLAPSSMLGEIRKQFPWFTRPPLIRTRPGKRRDN
jgi:hypothetical protein